MIGKNCEKCSPCIWVRRSQKASAELEAHSHVVRAHLSLLQIALQPAAFPEQNRPNYAVFCAKTRETAGQLY
jgi:hypothetical protein